MHNDNGLVSGAGFLFTCKPQKYIDVSCFTYFAVSKEIVFTVYLNFSLRKLQCCSLVEEITVSVHLT